jgi:kinesin family protein 18/19
MKIKVDQTKASIVDGAACAGKISVAQAKLAVISARLAEINAKAYSAPLSADLEAERALLQGLAQPEDQAIRPESALTVRMQRASNSNAMFDATMRAVSERRSEKLDEVNVDNVKLDAKCRKAEMEKLKMEGERDVMKAAVEDMAGVVVGLVGMLGRCTVMFGEATKLLGEPLDGEGGRGMEGTMRKVASLLGSVKDNNDETFTKLVGHSTEGYVMDYRANPAASSLENFTGYGTTFTRRVSSGPAVLQHADAAKNSRRSSAYGSGSSSELRRSHRSPRKSLRSSLVAQPYRRVSDREKKGMKNAKNVQWRDEVGQGDLDDGGPRLSPSIAVSITPATPTSEVKTGGSTVPSSCSSLSLPTPPMRQVSIGGSESEWEDENEKTDDSLSISYMSMSLPASTRESSLNHSTTSRSYGSIGARRPRPSRLDPSFLRSKSKGSALGSLAEDDESGSESPERRGHHPLSDRNLNRDLAQLPTPEDSGGSGNSLHIPRSRGERHEIHGSPSKRVPSTPGGLASGSGVGMGRSGSGRRRSNIGPMRNEKGRRRSSMIPQLSPANGGGTRGGGPRRVLLTSPAKRAKRASLSKSMGMGSMKVKTSGVIVGSTSMVMANLSAIAGADPNVSPDMSFNKLSKPTWR